MNRSLVLAVFLGTMAATAVASPAKVIRHLGGIENEFIIVLSPDTKPTAVEGLARSLAASYQLTLRTVWQYALRGFLCSGPPDAIELVADDPRVMYAEQNFTGGFHNPLTSGTIPTWLNGNYLWPTTDALREVASTPT